MSLNYYEIDPSPIASAQYKFFAELEAQEGGRFDVETTSSFRPNH